MRVGGQQVDQKFLQIRVGEGFPAVFGDAEIHWGWNDRAALRFKQGDGTRHVKSRSNQDDRLKPLFFDQFAAEFGILLGIQ